MKNLVIRTGILLALIAAIVLLHVAGIINSGWMYGLIGGIVGGAIAPLLIRLLQRPSTRP